MDVVLVKRVKQQLKKLDLMKGLIIADVLGYLFETCRQKIPQNAVNELVLDRYVGHIVGDVFLAQQEEGG